MIEQALNKASAERFATDKSIEGRDIQLLRIRGNPHALRTIWLIAQQRPGNPGYSQRLEN